MLKETPTRTISPRAYSALLIGLFGILQVLIVAVAFMGGYLFRDLDDERGLNTPANLFSKPAASFPLLNEALTLLKDNAYEELPDPSKLEYGMIRGMLEAYNEPFTVFVEPPQHELQTNQLQGKFGGIGARIERDTKNFVYLFPLPDSPAGKAGMQEGDRLLAVEALVVTSETTNDDLQAALRGPVGEKVTVTVGHKPEYAPVNLTIERAEVPLPSVTWNLVPEEERVGIVHINVIADTTPKEVTGAIEDLQKQGATHFVADVRNNGGGLVEAGVNTARLFLESGLVIEQQYRGKPVKTYSVEKPGPFAGLPLVVLVNKGTASAAEIFAGALQGQKRAAIIGVPTYGKDSIQLVFSLMDGSSLHVTAAKWWVPDLEPKIGGNGLLPDVLLTGESSDADNIAKAVETVLSIQKTDK